MGGLSRNLPPKPDEMGPDKISVVWTKQNAAKKAMVYFREQGYSVSDCAKMSGYSDESLIRWQQTDEDFALAMYQAWGRYQGRLIAKVEEKDPKYLLQNDFPERFRKDKEETQPNQSINFIGYDELANRLTDLLTGSESRPSTPIDSRPAQVTES